MVAAPAKAAPCVIKLRSRGFRLWSFGFHSANFFATTAQQIPSLQAPDGLLRGPDLLEGATRQMRTEANNLQSKALSWIGPRSYISDYLASD